MAFNHYLEVFNPLFNVHAFHEQNSNVKLYVVILLQDLNTAILNLNKALTLCTTGHDPQ